MSNLLIGLGLGTGNTFTQIGGLIFLIIGLCAAMYFGVIKRIILRFSKNADKVEEDKTTTVIPPPPFGTAGSPGQLARYLKQSKQKQDD